MRCLKRNKRLFYYATYTGKTEIEDSQGYATGQYTLTYSKPVEMYANISAARGDSEVEQFGKDILYDKTIITDADCLITENSILWIDTMPTIATDGTTTTPRDYVVACVAESLNFIKYAIRKVSA